MRRHAARALAVGAGTLFAAVTLGARPLAPEKIACALAEQDGTARADWWASTRRTPPPPCRPP